MKEKVDIKSVAAYCGVAISTVSRVLNNRPDVSQKTRENVFAAVQKLGYVPNNSARNLAKTGSDCVVIIARGRGNPFLVRIISAAEECIRENGCFSVIRPIDSQEDELRTASVLVAENKPLGVLLVGGRSDYTQEDIDVLGVPFVCVSFTNAFGTLDEHVCSSVSIDDAAEAQRAVTHLIKNGHRSIATLLAVEEDRSISDLRKAGYCAALVEAGIPIDEGLIEYCGSFDMEDAHAAALRLFDRRRDFTAIFAITDLFAVASIKAAAERGIKVPDDLSIMGMDGLPFTRYTLPELTTLEQPAERMGEESALLLFSMLRSKNNARHLTLPAKLRYGGTVKRYNPQKTQVKGTVPNKSGIA